VAELSHEINSPLAAIRNALYLAACHSPDPSVVFYLQLANEEIDSIAESLRQARQRFDCGPVAQAARAR
jgi:nitrogen-specific signal transduction histidine kinase